MVYVCRIFKRSLFQNSYLPGDGEEEGDVETREEDQMMFLEPVVIKKANNKNKIELANVCKYTGKQSGIVPHCTSFCLSDVGARDSKCAL